MFSYGPSHMEARTYIHQLSDTGCSPEDLLEVMNDKDEWRERVRDIRAGGTDDDTHTHTHIYIYIYERERERVRGGDNLAIMLLYKYIR